MAVPLGLNTAPMGWGRLGRRVRKRPGSGPLGPFESLGPCCRLGHRPLERHLTYSCPGALVSICVHPHGPREKSLPVGISTGLTLHPYLRNGPHGEGAYPQQHPLGPQLRKPSCTLIFPQSPALLNF